MIPKIIHYCWFGQGEMDEKIKSYIESWKNILPEYEIRCWNESNFDVGMSKYSKEAYDKKKYAFVSDYARLYALHKYGGIYLDTDMEVLKPLDTLLDKEMILGFDHPINPMLATCLIGAVPNNEFIRYVLEYYNNISFIDDNNNCNMTPNTCILTKLFEKYYETKLINDGKNRVMLDRIRICNNKVFHPLNLVTGKLEKNDETVAIHWHSLLWVSKKTKLVKFIRQKILVPLIGEKNYLKITEGIKK